MRNIWVVKKNDKDLSGLKSWGCISPIFPKSISPVDTQKQIAIIREDVLPTASVNDAILLTGPQYMICILVTAWLSKFDHVNLIMYSAKTNKYIEKRIKRDLWH